MPQTNLPSFEEGRPQRSNNSCMEEMSDLPGRADFRR
jgi:hypothetical protein